MNTEPTSLVLRIFITLVWIAGGKLHFSHTYLYRFLNAVDNLCSPLLWYSTWVSMKKDQTVSVCPLSQASSGLLQLDGLYYSLPTAHQEFAAIYTLTWILCFPLWYKQRWLCAPFSNIEGNQSTYLGLTRQFHEGTYLQYNSKPLASRRSFYWHFLTKLFVGFGSHNQFGDQY